MNKVLLILLTVVLALSVGLVGCKEEVPTKIKIGAVRSLTGRLGDIGNVAFTPVMRYWVDEVNAAGGIYVEEYDKKLEIELVIKDDNSHIDTMTYLLNDMVTSGDYHFVLAPCSTAFLQAAAGICSANNYVLIGAEGGVPSPIATTLAANPYLFSVLNYANWNQMEELSKILDAWQDEWLAPTPMKVYIMNDPADGADYSAAFVAEAAKYPGQFIIVPPAPKAVPPPDTNNVSAVITAVTAHLIAANTSGADMFCSFTYPFASLTTITQAIALDINFDAMLVGPACNFELMLDPATSNITNPDNLIGVMGFGAWNEYSSNETAAFAANYIDFLGDEGGRWVLDWWGVAAYYAGLQCLQQAIERAGTLDNDDVKAELAAAWPGSSTNPPFATVLGNAYFTDADGNPVGAGGGLLAKDCYAGQIGQWQKVEAPYWGGRAKPYGIGNATEWYIFEVIDLDDNQTALGIYPKPPWP